VGQERQDALEMWRNGNFAAAVEITQRELDVAPNNLDAMVVMGWSLIALGRYDEAQVISDRAIEVARFDHRAIENSGESHYFLGELEPALERFEQYAALAPRGDRIARVYSFMGEIYISLREYENADIAYSTALHLTNNRSAWWTRLGYARELAGKTAAARDTYQRAIELDPALVEAQRGLERIQSLLSG
jgi:tetratricopeptide (TPR) repeat protein